MDPYFVTLHHFQVFAVRFTVGAVLIAALIFALGCWWIALNRDDDDC